MAEPDRFEDEAVRMAPPAAPGRLALARLWLARQLGAERERWVLWLPVAFGAGIAFYFALPAEPPLLAGPLALVLVALAGYGLRRRGGPLLLLVGAGVFAAGFALGQARTAQVAAPVLAKRLGPVTVSGLVHTLSLRPPGVRLVLRQLDIPALDPAETPARVRVTVSSRLPEGLRPGERVRLRAVLQPPPRPAAPGAFDFARRAYFQRIGAVGFAVSRVTRELEAGDPRLAGGLWAGVQTAWARWRQAIAQRILAALPGPAGGIAAALMTGERGAIPPEAIAAMRDSGLAHLLAISGLHMGLVAGWLFFGLRAALALVPYLALRYPIKKWAAVAAVAGSFAYLLLVGATVPAQRAFVMVLLVFLAVLLDRTAISLHLVAWAAFAVLLVAPESLLGASFQMSFAAVAALVACYETAAVRGWFRAGGGAASPLATGPPDGGGRLARVRLYLASVLLTSVIAILATTPFAIYHFNRIAWYGLAANLVAVPLTGFWVMPWALLAFLLMPLGLEGLALAPMGWGVEGIIGTAARVSAWPGSVSVVQALPPAGLALVVAGGLWLCVWRRSWRLAGLMPIAAGLLTLALVRPPDVLAGGNAELLGVRAADGSLWVTPGEAGSYAAETWARRAGVTEAKTWSLDGPSAGGRLLCDGLGCVFRARGQVVALIADPRAFHEDCARADVVVALEPARRRSCEEPAVVIDRFDLWRNGAYALWLDPDGVTVESARAVSGERPWVRTPEAARRQGAE